MDYCIFRNSKAIDAKTALPGLAAAWGGPLSHSAMSTTGLHTVAIPSQGKRGISLPSLLTWSLAGLAQTVAPHFHHRAGASPYLTSSTVTAAQTLSFPVLLFCPNASRKAVGIFFPSHLLFLLWTQTTESLVICIYSQRYAVLTSSPPKKLIHCLYGSLV